jgi:DNA-binding NarL/FixJ family response regulator
VLIVDDMETFRDRFNDILAATGSFEVVGMAASGKEAVAIALDEEPDIILMDVVMETNTAGTDAAERIGELLPNTKVIFITVMDDDQTVLKAYQTGAADYLPKNAPEEEVVGAIHAAYQNQSPIRPAVADRLRREFKKLLAKEESVVYAVNVVRKLTPMELDILLLLCENRTRSEIAQLRCVELSTVKTHVGNLLKKFHQESTHDLVAMLRRTQVDELLRRSLSAEDANGTKLN